MNAQLQTITQLQTEPIQPQPNIPSWSLALRIAFRFSLVYLGLYCYATQIITSLFSTVGAGRNFPDPATLWPLRPVIFWTAAHIFHVNAPLSVFFGSNSGSSDTQVRLGHDLLPANDCHCRDRRLVTSRPQPGELR